MTSAVVDFDPFAAGVIADPYPYFERLLEGPPVQWSPDQEMWVVTHYDTVAAVMRDPVTFSSNGGMRALSSGRVGRNRTNMQAMLGISDDLRVLVSTDPPDHTRLRRLVSRAFTPKSVAELEPRLRTLADELVAGLLERADGGEADLVADLAVPFPITVIAELLGIPSERRAEFRRWSNAMVGALQGDWDPTAAMDDLAELFGFMTGVVEERRRAPGADLLSRLVESSPADDPEALTDMEIVMFGVLLLIAGNETTTNLVGNAANAFSLHPEQAARVRETPELLPAAIEEVLRWDSPVQGFVRATTTPVVLAGTALPADAVVLASFAAANRDPRHFPEPARFDVERRPGDHFAFGHGIHFCLGASLARLEARLVGESLLRSGARLEPAGGAQRTDSFVLRGFTRFPVRRA